MEDLSLQAISFALQGNWNKALALNLHIINEFGSNVDVLNRVARCYAELGELKKAKSYADKVLEIDPINPIAQKCSLKWKFLKDGFKTSSSILSANIFLEEPGKTRIVPLVKLAEPTWLLTLDCGCEVQMDIHHHHINIVDNNKKYIGKLPDDIATRLIKLIDQGNEYKAYVKTSSTHEVKVFLKEIKRSKFINHIPSFPAEKIQYVAFTAPELVHNKKPISTKHG